MSEMRKMDNGVVMGKLSNVLCILVCIIITIIFLPLIVITLPIVIAHSVELINKETKYE